MATLYEKLPTNFDSNPTISQLFNINSGNFRLNKNRTSFHPLHYAASRGDLTQINSSSNINVEDHDGNTPLHWAVRNGHLECVDHLLKLGAEINAMNKKGETPLLIACQCHSDQKIEIVRLLIDSNASHSLSNLNQETPLHHAIANNNTKITELLLFNGACPDTPDAEGETSIFWSIRYSHSHLLPVLFRFNADINAKNSDSETPLHFSSCVGEFECVKLIVEKGKITKDFDINALDDEEATPLEHAINNSNLEIADFLQKNGASSKIKRARH